MNQSITGIKRRSPDIKLYRSGYGVVGGGVDNHELDIAKAKVVASEASNGVLVQQVFWMASNCGRAREVHVGDHRFIGCLGEWLLIILRAKEHHCSTIYQSTIYENWARAANLNRMRLFSNFKFHHIRVRTGRPVQLLGHGRCVH